MERQIGKCRSFRKQVWKDDGHEVSQESFHLTAITISKMEAAQRQLRTAINIWFDDDGDVVSDTDTCFRRL